MIPNKIHQWLTQRIIKECVHIHQEATIYFSLLWLLLLLLSFSLGELAVGWKKCYIKVGPIFNLHEP